MSDSAAGAAEQHRLKAMNVRYSSIAGLLIALRQMACTEAPASAETLSGSAQQERDSPAPPLDRVALDAYIEQALVDYRVPGAAVAVIESGEVVYTYAGGIREKGRAGAITRDTRFLLGSLTRSMTATMMATLVEDGAFGWDTPVAELLPEFRLSDAEATRAVRMRDLMNHGSGVSSYETPLLTYRSSPLELIQSLAGLPVLAPPGQAYEYQIQMVATAGFLAARATGAEYTDDALQASFADLMQERLFGPIGMHRSTLDFEAAVQDCDHAVPHSYDPAAGHFVPVPDSFERFVVPLSPDRGVWASIDDVARFAAMHLLRGTSSNGQRVVSEPALLETWRGEVPVSEGVTSSIGWTVAGTGEPPALMHDGRTAGFTSRLLLLPESDLGVAVLTNRAYNQSFLEAVTAYAVEVSLELDHGDATDWLENDRAIYPYLTSLLESAAPATLVAVCRHLGGYDRGVELSLAAERLILSTDFGQLQLMAVPWFPNAYVNVGPVATGFTAQLGSDADGHPTLAVGFADLEQSELQLIHPLVFRKRGNSPSELTNVCAPP